MNVNDTAFQMGQMVGMLAIPVALGLGGYFVSKQMSAKSGKSVYWPTAVGILIGSVLLVNGFSKTNVMPSSKTPDDQSISVLDYGPSEEYLDNIPSEELDLFAKDSDNKLSALLGDKIGQIESVIRVVKMGGKNVVFYEARGSHGPTFVNFNGVVNGRLIGLDCLSMSGQIDPKCDQKARELFGQPEPAQ